MTGHCKRVPTSQTVNAAGARAGGDAARTLQLDSTITCPECGSATRVRMPVDACQFFWECPACAALLRPRPGDCCVFCSYGDAPCPSMQRP
jgi:hypothetical protein